MPIIQEILKKPELYPKKIITPTVEKKEHSQGSEHSLEETIDLEYLNEKAKV